MRKRIFCLSCRCRFESDKAFSEHPCSPIFAMYPDDELSREIKKAAQFKPSRLARFIDKLLSLDISFGLAFMGLVVMNCVLIWHINLTFTESLIESLSLGFAIPRLLK